MRRTHITLSFAAFSKEVAHPSDVRTTSVLSRVSFLFWEFVVLTCLDMFLHFCIFDLSRVFFDRFRLTHFQRPSDTCASAYLNTAE